MISTGRNIPYILKKPKQYILDRAGIENVLRANALFQLTNTFSGTAIVAVDDSDGSEHDLEFNSDGFIDHSALSSIGANVKLKTIKSQIVGGVDITQTNIANMPYLVKSGVVQVQATGILGALKDVDNQLMITDTYLMPRDLGVISIYSTTTTTWGVTRGGSRGFFANGFLALCYGTINYCKIMSGNGTQVGDVSPILYQINKGSVNEIYWNDTTKDWNWYANNASWSANFATSVDRVATNMSTGILQRLSGSTQDHLFHGEIQFIDGEDRASVGIELRELLGVS